MANSSNQKPFRVSTDGTSGSYIMVSLDQVEQVRKLLVDNGIQHWVDLYAISVDGRPAVVIVNLAKSSDPSRVQAILDVAA